MSRGDGRDRRVLEIAQEVVNRLDGVARISERDAADHVVASRS